MAIEVTLEDEEATRRFGEDLALCLAKGDLVALDGDLGAGKTALTRAVLRAAAGDPSLDVPSPTFTLVQTYDDLPFGTLTHVDLYRINRASEADELGLFDSLDDGVVVVEWPQKGAFVPDECAFWITITIGPDDSRQLTISGEEAALSRLQRSLDIREFLKDADWQEAGRHHLVGDASARAYETVTNHETGETCILMNAAPQPDGPPVRFDLPYSQIAHLAEDTRPFHAIATALRVAGFATPAVHHHDPEKGIMLLEDLGPEGVIDDHRRPIPERYEASVLLLAEMHRRKWPRTIALPGGEYHTIPNYSRNALTIEVELLTDWFLPWRRKQEVAEADRSIEADRQAYLAIWFKLIDYVLAEPRTIILRDYHSPNLIWRENETGFDRVGLIDFQDAVLGPAAYDVASLVFDARVDVNAQLRDRLITAYCDARANDEGFDKKHFLAMLALMTAHRSCKVLGIFVRLSLRDGKHNYLAHLPRVERALRLACRHPMLAPLQDWVNTAL